MTRINTRFAVAIICSLASTTVAQPIGGPPGGGFVPPTRIVTGGAGDITSVGATTGGGLTGGAASGAALLGLLTTCTDGQILKWTLATTSWGCAADAGGEIVTAGAALTKTGTTIDLVGSSDFTVTADLLDLSPTVTAPGTLATAGNFTGGDSASGDSHVFNGKLVGSASGFVDGLHWTLDATSAAYNPATATLLTTGTVNVALAARTSTGLSIDNSQTVFGGDITNPLTKRALYVTAGAGGGSGGENYAILADVGRVQFNDRTHIGNATTDAHTLLGTLNANTTAGTNGQILLVSAGLPQWGAPSAASIVDGAGTLNTIPLWTPDGNTLGNSIITQSGTTATLTGTLAVTGAATVGTTLDVDGDLAKFGSSDGHTYVAINTLNFQHAANASAAGWINYTGYLGGITQFRDLNIADGKNAVIATFTGSTKATMLTGILGVTGLVTATAGVTTPANLTTTGTGALVVSGTGSIGSTLGVTGLATLTAGATSPASFTTTGTGDLVSADALTVANGASIGDNIADTHIVTGITHFGSAGNVWMRSDEASLNFYFGDATTGTGYINYRSNGAFGASRNLVIADGQSATVVNFNGSAKSATFYGLANMTQAVYLGDAAADIVSLYGQIQVINDVGKLSTKSAGTMTYTNCGTGYTAVGDRTAGHITIGTTPGSCEVDWTTAFTAAVPTCILTTRGSTKTHSYTADSNKIVMTSPLAGQIYDWMCWDHF